MRRFVFLASGLVLFSAAPFNVSQAADAKTAASPADQKLFDLARIAPVQRPFAIWSSCVVTYRENIARQQEYRLQALDLALAACKENEDEMIAVAAARYSLSIADRLASAIKRRWQSQFEPEPTPEPIGTSTVAGWMVRRLSDSCVALREDADWSDLVMMFVTNSATLRISFMFKGGFPSEFAPFALGKQTTEKVVGYYQLAGRSLGNITFTMSGSARNPVLEYRGPASSSPFAGVDSVQFTKSNIGNSRPIYTMVGADEALAALRTCAAGRSGS